MPTINQVGSKFVAIWFVCLRTILPTRFKRFIILSTLFKKGYDEKIFDNLNFRNLNNRMHIAGNIKAMENISMVSTKLWSEVELQSLMREAIHCTLNGECVSIKDAGDIGTKLLSFVPEWLRYNQQRLIYDLGSLFASEKVHFTAQV